MFRRMRRRRVITIVILVVLVFLIYHFMTTPKKGPYNDYGWDLEAIGSQPSKDDLFYPDGQANYWKYTFDAVDLEGKILAIEGVFPHAKYMSYNIYNQDSYKTLGSLYDLQMTQKDGGEIVPGTSEYVVHVALEGTDVSAYANVLIIPKHVEEASVMLRYYGTEENPYGGVELPTVQAVDTATNEVVSVPESTAKRIPTRLATGLVNIFTGYMFRNVNVDNELESYKFDVESSSFGGLLSNYDNQYLIMPFDINKNEYALIKFKPPVESKSIYDDGDVRYWSLGFGDGSTRNEKTLTSEDLTVAEDGFVYVAITYLDESVLDLDDDVNYVYWKKNKNLMLIYRNLLTDEAYEYNMSKVPSLSLSLSLDGEPASNYIGDYAPSGFIYKIKQ